MKHQVWTCDRCKKQQADGSQYADSPPAGWTTATAETVNLVRSASSQTTQHLCPECSKDLREFLANQKPVALRVAIRALKQICYPEGNMSAEQFEEWKKTWEDKIEWDGEDVIAWRALEQMGETGLDTD